jgi:conjugal transfer pilus assembly protein TraW
MKTKLLLIVPLFLVSPWVNAKDLGVHGQVYAIAEDNLLDILMARAQAEVDTGKWNERVEQWKNQAKKQAARPSGIKLPRALKTDSHLYDPSVILPQDVKDSSGQIIRPKGTQANPLNYISMTRTLVFIDGDDHQQVDWMMALTDEQPDRYKVILTQGNVLDLAKSLDRRLFFDQQQIYSNKLAIKTLPAVVYQQGLYLRIDEVMIP